jgi:hypothetical protein
MEKHYGTKESRRSYKEIRIIPNFLNQSKKDETFRRENSS